MGTKTAPLVVEAESAYRDLDATSANGIALRARQPLLPARRRVVRRRHGRLKRFNSADIPVRRFTGLSSPVFHLDSAFVLHVRTGDWKVARTRRLESLRYSV
ncbi:MAG: hypothetical protein QM813_23135 [Verrucomicrobiota bacterium]